MLCHGLVDKQTLYHDPMINESPSLIHTLPLRAAHRMRYTGARRGKKSLRRIDRDDSELLGARLSELAQKPLDKRSAQV